jgi:hypothetical protein
MQDVRAGNLVPPDLHLQVESDAGTFTTAEATKK